MLQPSETAVRNMEACTGPVCVWGLISEGVPRVYNHREVAGGRRVSLEPGWGGGAHFVFTPFHAFLTRGPVFEAFGPPFSRNFTLIHAFSRSPFCAELYTTTKTQPPEQEKHQQLCPE